MYLAPAFLFLTRSVVSIILLASQRLFNFRSSQVWISALTFPGLACSFLEAWSNSERLVALTRAPRALILPAHPAPAAGHLHSTHQACESCPAPCYDHR